MSSTLPRRVGVITGGNSNLVTRKGDIITGDGEQAIYVNTGTNLQQLMVDESLPEKIAWNGPGAALAAIISFRVTCNYDAPIQVYTVTPQPTATRGATFVSAIQDIPNGKIYVLYDLDAELIEDNRVEVTGFHGLNNTLDESVLPVGIVGPAPSNSQYLQIVAIKSPSAPQGSPENRVEFHTIIQRTV